MAHPAPRRREGNGGVFFRPLRHAVLLAAAVLALPFAGGAAGDPPSSAAGDTPSISADTTWSGEVLLRQNVVVASGAVLRILPGTAVRIAPGKGVGITVLGRLRAEGTAKAPVVFAPAARGGGRAAWDGIRLGPASPGEHVLSGFRIEGAREGIAVTETSARIREGVFAGCATGVQVNQKARASLDNCVFDGNDAGGVVSLGGTASFTGCRVDNAVNVGIAADKGAAVKVAGCSFSRGKTGMFSLTDAPCRVEGSSFASLEAGLVARQMGKDSTVSRCAFENNGTGIVAVQFCAIEVSDSVFRGNATAIDVREFSTPRIAHNRFEANQAAVNLVRKSHARVEKNVFVHNRNAIVVNYSSYPLIAGNNFDRNDMGVRLEKFQSGEWEERAGSGQITAGEAARRGSRAMPAGVPPAGFPRRVNAKGNFWGPDAGRDPATGTLGKIWDGKKFGPVKYDGFGDGEYAIDVVDFSGDEPAPVKDAGPRAPARPGGGS